MPYDAGAHPIEAVPILPKIQPAIPFNHAGRRPVAPGSVLQALYYLPLRAEHENAGPAFEFLFAQLRRPPLHQRRCEYEASANIDVSGIRPHID
jgi:hypothetical protein